MFGQEIITRRCLLTLEGGVQNTSHPLDAKTKEGNVPRSNGT